MYWTPISVCYPNLSPSTSLFLHFEALFTNCRLFILYLAAIPLELRISFMFNSYSVNSYSFQSTNFPNITLLLMFHHVFNIFQKEFECCVLNINFYTFENFKKICRLSKEFLTHPFPINIPIDESSVFPVFLKTLRLAWYFPFPVIIDFFLPGGVKD